MANLELDSYSNTLQSPFINVAGILNFRDLGGYPVPSPANHSIRQNFLYRCAEPSLVTRDGIFEINALGITHIYDLRSNSELEKNRAVGRGDVIEWEGCKRIFAPVFKGEDYSPEALALRLKDYADGNPGGFANSYGYILRAGAQDSFRIILLHLANEPDKPLIVHCTAGKDRTGVLCALVLSLCGVEDEIVAHEYSLTEQGLTTEWKKSIIEHLSKNPALQAIRNPKAASNLISAKAVYMLATLERIRLDFGGPEGYIIAKCGLTEEDIANIRKNLIVEIPAIHKWLE
ncbi:hypothetical protein WAI453_012828 [Rhynchosporium graminicola]|uniref:Related to protein-tyrosine phosphatase n=1 Tax=Rhynchosporium graminicola TaxID=2792576 RepID=A0A1E1L8V4_9HELO|nr:related to protein-tyrosine phosphatase [Rhynchosporium commune]